MSLDALHLLTGAMSLGSLILSWKRSNKEEIKELQDIKIEVAVIKQRLDTEIEGTGKMLDKLSDKIDDLIENCK